jgi:carboxyl-terminal processing protease
MMRLLKFSSGLIGGLLLGLTTSALGSPDALLEKLGVLAEVIGRIENHYVDAPHPRQVIYGAANGALKALDAHSTFYSPQRYKELQETAEGEYAGVGLDLNLSVTPAKITAVHPDSPAAFAGILPNDRLLKINGTSTNSLSAAEARQALRGKAGTKVRLSVQRAQTESRWLFTLIRSPIRATPLHYQDLGDGLAYIKLSRFSRRVGHDLKTQLQDIPNLRGLILDLRDNAGGLFDEAVAVCDLFLSEGVIVSALGRHDHQLNQRSAQPASLPASLTLAILINGESASAAEIVAAALQDHRRATLFGQRSFGKGSVQTLFDLSDGSGIKLTVARYLSPNEQPIEGNGVTPDHAIASPDARDTLKASYDWLQRNVNKRP